MLTFSFSYEFVLIHEDYSTMLLTELTICFDKLSLVL